MSSIRTELIALDSNEFIIALRDRDASRPQTILVRQEVPNLQVHVPLQVLLELQRNLTRAELKDFYDLVTPENVTISHEAAEIGRVNYFHGLGATKGDAVIAAQLQAANVTLFVSENRHFLTEIPNLRFKVVSSEDALRLLAE